MGVGTGWPGMAKPLVSDALWAEIEPLLPPPRPRPKGGRPPVPNRAALTGILFVLKSGIPWEMLPQEMGSGCGMSCWRRLRDWQGAGIWGRASLDSASVRAKKGAKEGTGPNPTDRGNPGAKRHVIVDANGIPLAVRLSPANTHDSRLFEPLINAVPPIQQCAGRPRRRPAKLHADKAYDHRRCRRGITPRIARRGIESSERLGRHRWVAERTLAWFGRYRRLTVRYERRTDISEAFHHLAASLICLRFTERWFC